MFRLSLCVSSFIASFLFIFHYFYSFFFVPFFSPALFFSSHFSVFESLSSRLFVLVFFRFFSFSLTALFFSLCSIHSFISFIRSVDSSLAPSSFFLLQERLLKIPSLKSYKKEKTCYPDQNYSLPAPCQPSPLATVYHTAYTPIYFKAVACISALGDVFFFLT